jgi:fructokinase
VTAPLVTVIGEALIDLVPEAGPGDYKAHPGGSPFNVAVALARLGSRTALMARLGDHGFGRLLRETAVREGVELDAAARAAEPTTLAVVALDRPGQASYEFYVEGTADWQWTLAELRERPDDTRVVHFGSLASWTPPGSEQIAQLISEARTGNDGVLVSYDPNIRPTLLAGASDARRLVEQSVGRAHVVKASREDIEWLYPSQTLDEVAGAWTGLGAALVVVTDGADGATAYRAGARVLQRPGRRVNVVDTIGAGDSFTAALLAGLVRRDMHTPERVAAIADDVLAEVVDEAVLVSSLTCERAGADPPRLARTDAGSRPLTPDDFDRS